MLYSGSVNQINLINSCPRASTRLIWENRSTSGYQPEKKTGVRQLGKSQSHGASRADRERNSSPGYLFVAVAGLFLALISYAVWQTLRMDDDLWVED